MSPRPVFTGSCRICGCGASEDETRACVTPTGDRCHWFDFERTVCSNTPCVRKWEMERKKFKDERAKANRKRTPAEICAIICEERKARRKKKGTPA